MILFGNFFFCLSFFCFAILNLLTFLGRLMGKKIEQKVTFILRIPFLYAKNLSSN